MRKLLLYLSVALLVTIAIGMPVYAVEAPDNKGDLDVRVFRNLAETGDMLVVFQWNWDYSDNYSDTPASDSIMYRLYDTDGTTLFVATQPYVFSPIETNGYGNNVGSLYFNAADNLTWGEAYILNIYGTPAFFDPAENQNYTLATDDYSTVTSQEDNRNELYAYIMLLCDRFDAFFDIELKTSSDSGVVLSSYGELLFRGALDGLQSLCPQLFFIQLYIPEAMPTDYDTSLMDTYTDRLVGTDIEKGFERLGDLMGGMSGGLAAGVLFFIGIMGLCIWTAKKGWPIELGIGGSIIIGIFAAILVGDVMFTLLMIGSLIAGMGIFYLLTFKRS